MQLPPAFIPLPQRKQDDDDAWRWWVKAQFLQWMAIICSPPARHPKRIAIDIFSGSRGIRGCLLCLDRLTNLEDVVQDKEIIYVRRMR